MTKFVMPEPYAGEQEVFEAWLHDCAPSGDHESVQAQWLASYEYREFIELHEYTADQLRQAVLDALEMAATQCEKFGKTLEHDDGGNYAEEIRALKEQIV